MPKHAPLTSYTLTPQESEWLKAFVAMIGTQEEVATEIGYGQRGPGSYAREHFNRVLNGKAAISARRWMRLLALLLDYASAEEVADFRTHAASPATLKALRQADRIRQAKERAAIRYGVGETGAGVVRAGA